MVVDDGGVFHRDRHIGGQLVDDRAACRHGTGADVQRHQADRFQIVGEEDQLRAEGGRAAAAPCKAAAGGGRTFPAVLGPGAGIGGAPDDVHAVVGPQQIAREIGQDDRSLPAGCDAVFGTLAGLRRVDMHFVVKVGGAARQNGLDGGMGDVAHGSLLAAVGVDAEAARYEPEVALVVEDDGKEVLFQRPAQHPLGGGFDVDIQHLFENGQRGAGLIGGLEHQDMVVAGGADDEVPPIHKGIGALDDIPAAIVLCG